MASIGRQMAAQTMANQMQIFGLYLKSGEQAFNEIGQRIAEHRQIGDTTGIAVMIGHLTPVHQEHVHLIVRDVLNVVFEALRREKQTVKMEWLL